MFQQLCHNSTNSLRSLEIPTHLVVSITHYFPLPFLAFHSIFSLFRSRLAFCPSLKSKTIKNFCLLNILLLKKRDGISLPLCFFLNVVKEYFPLSAFQFSDLKPTQWGYFVRLIAGLLACAQHRLLPVSEVNVLLLEAQM